MTLAELLAQGYAWADANAALIFGAALAIPAVGTALAWIGKQGRTDKDGRVIASLVIGLAVVFAAAVLAGLGIALPTLGRSLLQANVLLIAAPVACVVASLLGMSRVFPLRELASVRTLTDIAMFFAACAAAIWLLSKFRGWGVLFFGSLGQLLVIGVFAFVLLRRLFRRAFGTGQTLTGLRETR